MSYGVISIVAIQNKFVCVFEKYKLIFADSKIVVNDCGVLNFERSHIKLFYCYGTLQKQVRLAVLSRFCIIYRLAAIAI